MEHLTLLVLEAVERAPRLAMAPEQLETQCFIIGFIRIVLVVVLVVVVSVTSNYSSM